MATGSVANGKVNYIAAFMNATDGYEKGNEFGGFLYATRATVNAWGNPTATEDGLAIGFGGYVEDGPATTTMAASANILFSMKRMLLTIEGLCDKLSPQDVPKPAPTIADTITRCGGYGELGYTLKNKWEIQPIVRGEYFNDNMDLKDAGDAFLLSGGINASMNEYTRVQLQFTHRMELEGDPRKNNSLILAIQGAF